MIQGHSLFSSSGLIGPLDFGQTLFSSLWLPKQTCFWTELDAELGRREKRNLCLWLHTWLVVFIIFFSSDSYFLSQDWSLQFTEIPACIAYITPRDSQCFILAWVSSSAVQQLGEILTSSFTLEFWQGNQMSSWLLLSHYDCKHGAQEFAVGPFFQGTKSLVVK